MRRYKRFKCKEVDIDDYKKEIACADAKLVITDDGQELNNYEAVELLNSLYWENIALDWRNEKLFDIIQELKEIIFRYSIDKIFDRSYKIGEDMDELNEVFESENINDLINFCKQWCENGK